MKVYIQLKECSTGDQYVNHWSYRLYTFGGNGYDLHFKKRYKKKHKKKEIVQTNPNKHDFYLSFLLIHLL